MPTVTLQPLSIRAFAKAIGRDESTVREKVRQGKLTVDSDGRIPDLAYGKRQWKANTSPKRVRAADKVKARAGKPAKVIDAPATAAAPLADPIEVQQKQQAFDRQTAADIIAAMSDPRKFLEFGDQSQYERLAAGAKALMAFDELQRKKGLWVRVSDAKAEFARLIGGLRSRLLAIPGMVAHRVNPDAAPEARRLIAEAIADALEEISADAVVDAAVAVNDQRLQKRGQRAAAQGVVA